MAEETELLVKAELALLHAKIASLEETQFPTLAASWDEGIAPDLTEGGEAFPWTKVSFGYKIDPDGDNTVEVRIYTGDVNGVTIAETNVSCSSGTNIVYARVAKATGGAGTIQIAGSLPSEDATYRYYHLYTFTRTGTAVVLTKATRPYNIETGRQLPSNADATQYHVLQISADVGAADDPTKWTIATVKWI